MKDNDIYVFPIPEISKGGMTLRDYFAAKAMQAMVIKYNGVTNEEIANDSYKLADAMLTERAK